MAGRPPKKQKEVIDELITEALATCQPEDVDATAQAHTRLVLERRFAAVLRTMAGWTWSHDE